MSKHNHNNPEKPQAEAPEAEIPESMEKMPEADAEEAAEEANEEMQRIEALQQQLNDARAAVEKEKKEYLFLMADFDNFRKRVVKEKAEILRNGAEKVLAGLLPIVDDFERGLEATAGTDNAEGVREGMELIYNKLVKYLTGADFDADMHEAIATVPAASDEQKGKVLDTVQKGYMINDKVLRHAKVAVGA